MDSNNDIIISSYESEGNHNYRKTSPEMTIKLWKMIEKSDFQCNENQLLSQLSRQMNSFSDVCFDKNRIKQLVKNAIEDNLIVVEMKENLQQFGLRYVANLKRSHFDHIKNDWYCFECHSCYEHEILIHCNQCFRSFHKNCLNQKVIVVCDKFQCNYCEKFKSIDHLLRINCIEKSRLNKLFSLLIDNLQNYHKCSDITNKFEMKTSEKLEILIFKRFDLKSIQMNALTESYESLKQFENDFKLFVHNYWLFLSTVKQFNQKFSELLKLMGQFEHEISELKLCVDCYQYSSDTNFNDNINPHEWFTEVCEPPHELVLAQMPPYPYWPSKVIAIKNNGQTYDVRFFDPPKFSRLEVSVNNLKSIQYKQEISRDLEEPFELMELHKQKLREKGIQFIKTIIDLNN